MGFEPVDLLADIEHKFQPTVELLRSARKVEGLIVASPSNPTGTTVSETEMRALAHYCGVHGIRLISDEIYHGILFGGATVTAAAYSDSAIVINSFSKYFSMTGWRLGWMVVPPDMLRAIECLAQNLFISAPALSQLAAIAAFDCKDELDGHVRRYRENRDLLLDGLAQGRAGSAHRARRRVLSLCRCLASHQRQPRVSAGACWSRRGWRRRRGWISIASVATGRCAFPLPARRRKWRKPQDDWQAWKR